MYENIDPPHSVGIPTRGEAGAGIRDGQEQASGDGTMRGSKLDDQIFISKKNMVSYNIFLTATKNSMQLDSESLLTT